MPGNRPLQIAFVLLSLCFSSHRVFAENPVADSSSFYNLSLEQLMNVEVTVASQVAMTAKESPGVVTVITEEELRRSGCDDLMELLQRLPGIDFGVDVEGVVGIGVRGNWGHEGKVLMLIDGQEMNEELFSTLQFGRHMPLQFVRRIEIIRGPGSAIYGGNAEYAVINIQTTLDEKREGITATASYGQMQRAMAGRSLGVAGGHRIGELHWNYQLQQGEYNRSDRTYQDNLGDSYDMKENSDLSHGSFATSFLFRGLRVSGMLDRYHTHQRDGYEGALTQAYPTNFDSWHLNAMYEKRLGDKWTLSPGIRVKQEAPYNFTGTSAEDEFTAYDRTTLKKRAFVNAQYDSGEQFNLSLGASYYQLIARDRRDDGLFFNGSPSFYIDNASVFAQAIIKTRPANITLGARYNYNNRFDPAFVPRIGLNRVRDGYHVKLLYSAAFRAPSVENIDATSAGIRPESTTVAEIEAGVRITHDTYLTANLYDVQTKDVIVFFYENENEDSYRNAGRTGTRGAELDFRWKTNWGYLSVSHAYYTSDKGTGVEEYVVPGVSGVHLAFPAHKSVCSANVRLSDRFNITPAVTGMSKRFGARINPDSGDEEAVEFRPVVYADLAIHAEKFLHDRLRATLACMNLFNDPVDYIQPYNSNHAPLPGPSRELRLRLTYRFLNK